MRKPVSAGQAVEYCNQLPPNEPVFVLRAQDVLSIPLLNCYGAFLHLVQVGKTNDPMAREEGGLFRELKYTIADFKEWQAYHPIKLPD